VTAHQKKHLLMKVLYVFSSAITIYSILIVFIDYTIPVRVIMLERYPELRVPDGPFDLDTPLPSPPTRIDWSRTDAHIIPVNESPVDNDDASRSRTPPVASEPASDTIGNTHTHPIH
jgi:hypothetical protein